MSFNEGASRGTSRFFGSEQARCAGVTLVRTRDASGITLTAIRDEKSSVVFRGTSEPGLIQGCVDLTGDGAPELVLMNFSATDAGSTEVISLEGTPKSLFKAPFELELRRTRGGPFAYELVNDDGLVFTEPQLPVVFAYRGGRFERIGSKDGEYWRGRREPVRRVLECYAKMPEPMPRPFANLWFAASLYVGDWEEERKAFSVDPVQLLELELARPAFAPKLDGDSALPALPPNVWLASKDASAGVEKALAALATLPVPPEITEFEVPDRDDAAEASPPPGFRFLNVPKGRGTLSERCGNVVVEQVNDDEMFRHVRLRTPDGRYVGRIVPEIDVGYAAAEWCFDLTGDGVPELLVTESSGGAHCCTTYRVISLGATTELLLDFPAGYGWLEGPSNLDKKGAYELLARDDLLVDGASSSPFAGTYFVPIVFVLENGKYVRRTRRFKKLLEQERAELLAEYREADPNGFTDDPSGWMALSLLLGDWPKVKSRLPIEPSARAWFDPETTLARIERKLER